MKITNWPDRGQFNLRPCVIGGKNCYLINPYITPPEGGSYVQWNKDNLIFRSSIWTEDGELVSPGFKKFFNYGEKPEVVPDPTDLDGVAVEKLDGSLLAISQFNNELIIRTRGSVNAKALENGHEIDYLMQKYPKAFNNTFLRHEINTLLFEWVSPTNRIVLEYPEPDLFFIGMINHHDYSYLTQDELDELAEYYGFKRPKTYHFGSLSEMVESVRQFKGIEGVCFYYNNGQDIKKIKGDDYLAKHAFRSQATNENLVDLFISLDCPQYSQFRDYICNAYDYETWEFIKPIIKKLYTHYTRFYNIILDMKSWVPELRQLSRKDAAMKIQTEYGKEFSSWAFMILDGKEILPKEIKKKLLYLLSK